jgi:hypothetical protein
MVLVTRATTIKTFACMEILETFISIIETLEYRITLHMSTGNTACHKTAEKLFPM